MSQVLWKSCGSRVTARLTSDRGCRADEHPEGVVDGRRVRNEQEFSGPTVHLVRETTLWTSHRSSGLTCEWSRRGPDPVRSW